jgi:nitroimidazol reductase NimA-like FMN-containing flavoprotein (pyridoxamine 5'-phosphate oxidase superfamily)
VEISEAPIGGTTDLSRIRRLPELAAYDRETIFRIIDATTLCHVGTIVEGRPLVLPSLHVRDGDTLLLHGSRSSRLLRSIVDLDSVCVTITLVDGIIVARSAFNSSIAYRSVAVFGPATLVTEPQEKAEALERLIDGIIPGRSGEVRASTESELNRTSIVRIAIDEASAKVSVGPPQDDEGDVAGSAWAGVIPQRTVLDGPIPAPDGAVGRGLIGLPDSVRRLIEGS